MRQQFVKTITSVGKKDKRLIVMTGDVSHYRLKLFAKACPGRYFNIGICENTITTMAAGLRKVGLIPVIHSMTPFIIERSYEQVKLDLGYQELGCNIVTVGGAFDYSTLGCTHHCYTDFALLKPLPDTQIFCPGSKREFDMLFREVYQDNKINYFRVSQKTHNVKLGKIKAGKGILVKKGSKMTIVVTGGQLDNVIKAVGDENVEIVYIHTIKPLDYDLIYQSTDKTKRVLVIEEHSMYGGLTDDVFSVTSRIGLNVFRYINIPDTFIRGYGSYEDLCKRLGFTVENIKRIIKEKC